MRGGWLKVGSLTVAAAAVALAAGPLIGTLLIVFTDVPLALLNLIAGVVYALTMPFVALTTMYVYFDARVRDELSPTGRAGGAPRRDRSRRPRHKPVGEVKYWCQARNNSRACVGE